MRYLLILGMVIIIVLGVVSVVSGQEKDRYFPETGHTMDARFVPFFEDHGGQEIFGYPITDAFVDPITGLLVQYFQNTRVELAPVEGEDELQPRFTPLGEVLGGWQPPGEGDATTIASKSGCRFYPETWHSVCHSFLEYYDNHGGSAVFGYPISEPLVEDNHLVQYFQRFRLDWLPTDTSYHVQVAPLGQVHYDLMGYNRDLLENIAPDNETIQEPIELILDTSVASPMMQPGGTQYIYLTVRDHNLKPITGASALLTATFPTGSRVLLMPQTDKNGMSQVSLSIDPQAPASDIALEFQVMFGEILLTTRDAFIIR